MKNQFFHRQISLKSRSPEFAPPDKHNSGKPSNNRARVLGSGTTERDGAATRTGCSKKSVLVQFAENAVVDNEALAKFRNPSKIVFGGSLSVVVGQSSFGVPRSVASPASRETRRSASLVSSFSGSLRQKLSRVGERQAASGGHAPQRRGAGGIVASLGARLALPVWSWIRPCLLGRNSNSCLSGASPRASSYHKEESHHVPYTRLCRN